MLFNSVPFAIFFVVVTTAYFLISRRFRPALLLVSSIFFYMYWNLYLVWVLGTLITIDYWCARAIGAASKPAARRGWLLLSLVSNLGLLASFKYYDFLAGSLSAVLSWGGLHISFPPLHPLLPLGISFHTFQSLSYTIDVYHGLAKPERRFGTVALYVLFYPQLVAGPIERSNHLLVQLQRQQEEPIRHDFDYRRVVSGLRLMAWGLFKKVVIADRLALYVNQVYGSPFEFSGWPLVAATYAFAFQIYCDFSGYTDMAIGAARVMGFDLLKNFNRPYFAKSIQDFWHRWHITLSTWFRDYVYFPLGGSRVSPARLYFNFLVVFALSGLWHGANWTFVIWGLLFAAYQCASVALTRWRKAGGWTPPPDTWLRRLTQVLITFHLVCFAWIFFRAATLPEAMHIVGALWSNLGDPGAAWRGIGIDRLYLVITAGLAAFLLWVDWLLRDRTLDQLLEARPRPIRWAWYLGLALVGLLFAVDASNDFIYFQF